MNTPEIAASEAELLHLASPQAVRERAIRLLALAEAGGTAFRVNAAKLEATADLVVRVTRETYPEPAAIPFHARWEHFRAGGVDRVARLDELLAKLPADERARAKIDLVVVSVLLDAGAGAEWAYTDSKGSRYTRSEGLAVASFDMFVAGAFSSDPSKLLRADAAGLGRISAEVLARGFQASATNPLVGLEGRAALLQRLGEGLRARPDFFGVESPRPSGLMDRYRRQAASQPLTAARVLQGLLFGFQDMWPARVRVGGTAFGDAWIYPLGGTPLENLVPFHKLSQWLAYSLIEPLEEAGLPVSDPHSLTGLPEYRNGGLLLDTGVLELRQPADLARFHAMGSPLVIEWRALTVALLERVAEAVRSKLGLSEAELPLGKVLQGGTWAAGRRTAQELRSGLPPLQLELDGTVF